MDVKVDQIVVVRGKVQLEDEQDTATILVDSLDVNLEVARAAEDEGASHQQPSARESEPAQAVPAGNAASGASQTAEPRQAPDNSSPPPPVWEEDWSDRANSGEAHEARATPANGAQRAANGRPAESKAVIVEVDPAANWQEAFRQAVDVSHRYSGPDSLSLQLAGKNLSMDFGEGFTQYCPELEAALRQLNGIVRVSCR